VGDTLSAGIMGVEVIMEDTVMATVATVMAIIPITEDMAMACGATLPITPMVACAGVQDTGHMTPILEQGFGYLGDGFHAIKSK
jgi:hypothetical protein